MTDQEIKEIVEAMKDYIELEKKFSGLMPVAFRPVTAKIKLILKKL